MPSFQSAGAASPLAVTIEDAFRLRTPEAYGYGIMDDRVIRLWWTQLRRRLAPALPRDLRNVRYTTGDLACEENAFLRDAVREAHARTAKGSLWPVSLMLPDEEARQISYIRRPWPRVRVSIHPRTPDFDPLSDARFSDARRCHQCFGRKLHPVARGMIAYACLLIALGEPVPDDLADDLIWRIAEELACLPLAEEYSGYGNWTVRSDCLRVFGAHLDPGGRHPLAPEFDHPVMKGECHDMASLFLARSTFGRDLDGFLLTPLGTVGEPPVRVQARQVNDGFVGRAYPSLVAKLARDRMSPRASTLDHTPVSLFSPFRHLWGEQLPPTTAKDLTTFIAANQAILLAHWRGEADSVDLLGSLKDTPIR